MALTNVPKRSLAVHFSSPSANLLNSFVERRFAACLACRVNRHLSHDILRYLPALAVPIALGTLSTIIFARIAAPPDLGRFLLVTALSASISLPCAQWLQQAVLRFYPVYALKGEARGYIRCVALLSLASGVVATLVMIVVLWVGFSDTAGVAQDLLAAALLTFFTVASAGRASVLQATFALTRFSLLNSLGAVLKFVLPLALLYALPPFEALLWGSAIAAFLLWAALMVQRPAATAPLGEPWGLARTLHAGRESASFGLPLSVSEVGVQVLQFSDRYAVGALIGPAAVGLYGTNYSIAEKLVILVQAPLIYAAHSPIVAAWERGDRREVASLIRTAMRWLMLFGAPVVAFTVVRGDLVSSLLLGQQYAEGHAVIPIAAASILVYAASQYGHKTFELGKQTWVITSALLTAAVCNVVGVIVLILAIGYLGGALGTAVGYGVYALLVFVLSRRRSSAFAWEIPWRTLLLSCAGALLASIAWALLVPQSMQSATDLLCIAAFGLFGLAMYVAVLLVSRELPIPYRVGRTVRIRVGSALRRRYGAASRPG
jgi:O-antigen/teichoic acid export membrane protein